MREYAMGHSPNSSKVLLGFSFSPCFSTSELTCKFPAKLVRYPL